MDNLEDIVQKTKTERHLDICKELNALYIRKNHDYGDSFHQTFVEEGFAMPRIRLADKFNRFKTLSRCGNLKVNDESIRDTLIDLANYAIMTVMEMDDICRGSVDVSTCETTASSPNSDSPPSSYEKIMNNSDGGDKKY